MWVIFPEDLCGEASWCVIGGEVIIEIHQCTLNRMNVRCTVTEKNRFNKVNLFKSSFMWLHETGMRKSTSLCAD